MIAARPFAKDETMQRLTFMLVAPVALLGLAAWLQAEPASSTGTSAAIDFNRDIRPILSENCFRCHGPDEKQLKAKLRLDLRGSAVGRREDGAAIVPGQSAKSLLIERITAEDEQSRMPPLKIGKRLTPQQIELLKKWIDTGASYAQHWAFVAPKRPTVPSSLEISRRIGLATPSTTSF